MLFTCQEALIGNIFVQGLTVLGRTQGRGTVFPQCAVPENIPTPPTGGYFCFAPPPPPPGNSSLASYFASKILSFNPPPPRNFLCLSMGCVWFFSGTGFLPQWPAIHNLSIFYFNSSIFSTQYNQLSYCKKKDLYCIINLP